tara:strand:+ start:82 stop:564 length:483 start_codon:yes stop_codon:yes gene_type:complete
MNKSELKQLIREELKKKLSRRDEEDNIVNTFRDQLTTKPTNKFSKEDILKKIRQKRKEELERRRSEDINESPQPLFPRKDIIANAIENTSIPIEAFAPQRDKGVIVNFIRNGNPSEDYLGKMMSILKKNDVNLKFTPSTPLPDRSIEDTENFNAILSKNI